EVRASGELVPLVGGCPVRRDNSGGTCRDRQSTDETLRYRVNAGRINDRPGGQLGVWLVVGVRGQKLSDAGTRLSIAGLGKVALELGGRKGRDLRPDHRIVLPLSLIAEEPEVAVLSVDHFGNGQRTAHRAPELVTNQRWNRRVVRGAVG